MSAARLLRATLLVAATGLPSGHAAAEETESLNPMRALDKATLQSFVQKPLFDPARELPPPAPPVAMDTAPPPPPPLEPPPTLQLLGIVHGRRDLAIVHKDGNEKTVVLRSGDQLGSWTVEVRPPLGIALRSGAREVDLAMFKAPPGAPPPPVSVGQLRRSRSER